VIETGSKNFMFETFENFMKKFFENFQRQLFNFNENLTSLNIIVNTFENLKNEYDNVITF